MSEALSLSASLAAGSVADSQQISDMDLLNSRTELELQFSAYQRLSVDFGSPLGLAVAKDFALTAAKLTYIYDILVGKPKQATITHNCFIGISRGFTRANESFIESTATEPYLKHAQQRAIDQEQTQLGSDFRNTVFIHTNFFRLLLLRVKRFAASLEPIGATGVGTQQAAYMAGFDQVFRFVGVFYYLPRFGLNLFFTLKRIIPGSWMSKEEQELGWWQRLKHQWEQRWFQFANDAIWILMGVLTGFVLSTPAGMIGVILLYAFDVGAMLVKRQLDTKRMAQYLKTLQQQITELTTTLKSQQDANYDAETIASTEFKITVLQHKQQLIQLTQRQKTQDLNFNFAVTVGLLSGMLCGFGAPLLATGLAASVICPIVGMSIVLLTCLAVIGRCYVWPRIKPWFANANEVPPTKASEPLKVTAQNTLPSTLDQDKKLSPPISRDNSLEDSISGIVPSATVSYETFEQLTIAAASSGSSSDDALAHLQDDGVDSPISNLHAVRRFIGAAYSPNNSSSNLSRMLEAPRNTSVAEHLPTPIALSVRP